MPFEQQLPQPVQLTCRQARCPFGQLLAFVGAGAFGFAARDLRDGDAVSDVHLGAHQCKRFHTKRILLVHCFQQGLALAFEDMAEQSPLRAFVGEAEHVAHPRRAHPSLGIEIGMRDRLVEDRKPVADRTFGGIGNDMQRLSIGLDAFLAADFRKMRFEQFDRDSPQVEALRAAEHCNRQFLDFGRREEELHMRRRLFERLEQRIEGIARQHVDFVDDVDLVARRDRRIAHSLDDLAHVVDTCMARRVHFDDIDMAPFGNRAARLALAAGADRRATLPVGADTVERLGDQPRGRGLADPAHAGHQEGMRQPIPCNGIGERAYHRFLPDKFGKGLRAVFACQYAIGLRRIGCNRWGHGSGWGRGLKLGLLLGCASWRTAEHRFLSGVLEFRHARRVGLFGPAFPRKAVRIVR